MVRKIVRLLARAARVFGLSIGLVAVVMLASWLQACVLALAAPKGLVIEKVFTQPYRHYWAVFWQPQRDTLLAHTGFTYRTLNEYRREVLEPRGERVEQLDVPDDGEDVFSLWIQKHLLSRLDRRFVDQPLEERALMWNKNLLFPTWVEWYGFPFHGWEVRFDELNMRPQQELPVLFGIDTGIRRLSRPWQWQWRWWLGESPRYPSAPASRQIPNLVLPVVPRIPQALANGVFTLAAGWGVWWLVKRMRADRRELRGRCGGCGYPRPTGSAGPGGAGRESPQTCPECGCTARVVVRPLLGGRRFGVAWVRRG